jgi:F-type H+-transporting ATPase subunit b
VNINLTLVIQMAVFALTVWIAMKFLWPMLYGLLDERAKKIARGLAAGEKGEQDLAKAGERAETVINEARTRANEIVDKAERRANDMVEAARTKALEEGERLVTAARAQIELATTKAREDLRKDVARLAVSSASKLLGREIDAKAHADLLGTLAKEI